MKERNRSLDLYYLGSKLIAISFFIIALYFKQAYGLDKDYAYSIMFFLIAYLVANIVLILRLPEGRYAKKKILRVIDYFVVIYLALLSLNLYGLIPIGFLLGLYVVYYFREISLLLLFIIFLLLIKAILLHQFTREEIVLGILYLLGSAFISSKLNLLWVIQLKNTLLTKYRNELKRKDVIIGELSKKISIFEEILKFLELLSRKKHLEDLPNFLKGVLKAEVVYLQKADKPIKVNFNREEFIVTKVGNIIFIIKPKEKYLLNDERYKEKIKTLITILKPYIESFLANSK